MGLHPLISGLFTRIGPEREDGDDEDSMNDDENKRERTAGRSSEQMQEMRVLVNRDVVSFVKADNGGGSRLEPT